MATQLTLRFHKKLIEALKVRAGRENTSVNVLAASLEHRPGLCGAVRPGSILRTAGAVHTVRPSSGVTGSRASGETRYVLPTGTSPQERILRHRRTTNFSAAGGL